VAPLLQHNMLHTPPCCTPPWFVRRSHDMHFGNLSFMHNTYHACHAWHVVVINGSTYITIINLVQPLLQCLLSSCNILDFWYSLSDPWEKIGKKIHVICSLHNNYPFIKPHLNCSINVDLINPTFVLSSCTVCPNKLRTFTLFVKTKKFLITFKFN